MEERIGKSKINSMSKIKKISATKKNCIEKLLRLLPEAKNPHSKGLKEFKSNLRIIDNVLKTPSKIIPKIKLVKTTAANINIKH